MSAFDDEFGLFGDEHKAEDDERRSTLGARKIATGETIIDEIEPEEERTPRRRTPQAASGGPHREYRRAPLPEAIAYPRALELLSFLVKKLVSKPEMVHVALQPDARRAVLELDVAPDDLGKVIGRGGRIAQALRTLVRAGAEGRVTIDIVNAAGHTEDANDTQDAP
jgi:predicted RNA-binding protein YlqC (UPF0109 family)